MKQGKEHVLSEFHWMSVGEHVRWLEQKCQLKEFSPNDVHSMRLTEKTGVNGLLLKKMKLMELIQKNTAAIRVAEEEFAYNDYTSRIVAVIRGNMEFAISIIEEQIKSLETMIKHDQAELVYVPISDEEIPF